MKMMMIWCHFHLLHPQVWTISKVYSNHNNSSSNNNKMPISKTWQLLRQCKNNNRKPQLTMPDFIKSKCIRINKENNKLLNREKMKDKSNLKNTMKRWDNSNLKKWKTNKWLENNRGNKWFKSNRGKNKIGNKKNSLKGKELNKLIDRSKRGSSNREKLKNRQDWDRLKNRNRNN